MSLKRALESSEDERTPSPQRRKLVHKLKLLRQTVRSQATKIKTLQQRLRRTHKRVSKLQDLVDDLHERSLIGEDQRELLLGIETPQKKILERLILKAKGERVSKTYPPEVRSFALNLNFYSPRAYKHVRETFKGFLPHERTISGWYQSVNCGPGLTKEAFIALKGAVTEAKKSNQTLICNLSFDELAIRQQVEWNGNSSVGYVDIGDGLQHQVKATQIIVFMVVCINRGWKIPVGFFPIISLTAEQKKNLLMHCLSDLLDTGIEVCGVTFDGAPANLTVSKLLGCEISCKNSTFHFDFRGKKVVIYPDPCHMLKLVRNCFCDMAIICTRDGNIEWRYLVSLQDLQDQEGLHLGTKLRKAHIYFSKQKMKVRLAVQTLSKSVADAIDFCRNVLQLPEFVGSESTTKFIRALNEAFDILNSLSFKQPQWKTPLCRENIQRVVEYASYIQEYFSNLRFSDGQLVMESRRKTGFLGILICLKNLEIIYKQYIESGMLFYIPTYKLNQDHLELFFSSIRMRLGYNTNPTVKQFIAAYRRLVVHCQIRERGIGNCMPLENIGILNSKLSTKPIDEINATANRSSLISIDINELHATDNAFNDHDYMFDPSNINEYTTHVVKYIAGYIVFKLEKLLKCKDCIKSLQGSYSSNTLISYKSYGFLKYPSQGVVEICEVAEKLLRQQTYICNTNESILTGKSAKIISISTLKYFENKLLFADYSTHLVHRGHYSLLIKAIIDKYINIRFHYISKVQSEKSSIRNFYNHVINFRGM